jgi:hypothetical protein
LSVPSSASVDISSGAGNFYSTQKTSLSRSNGTSIILKSFYIANITPMRRDGSLTLIFSSSF